MLRRPSGRGILFDASQDLEQFSARLQRGERTLLISILNAARSTPPRPKVRDDFELRDLEDEYTVLKQWCECHRLFNMDAFYTEWVRKDIAGIDFRLQFVVQCLTTHMEGWDEHEPRATDSDLDSSSACEEAGPDTIGLESTLADEEQEVHEDEKVDEREVCLTRNSSKL